MYIISIQKIVPRIMEAVKLEKYPLGKRFFMDRTFRAELSSHASLMPNVLYAIVQLVAGIYYHSLWFGALAMYYILLAAMRFFLLRYLAGNKAKGNFKAELRQYRFCGIVLLLMTPVFASILMVHKNSYAQYGGLLIYLMAICAFCKIIIAIVNMIKFPKCLSQVLSAAKVTSLIAALMSVLTLETAMLWRFGGEINTVFYQGMLGTSGGAVCVFVLGIAAYMVIYSTRRLQAAEGEG
ncbi:MAG: hypothetical protein ACI4DN_07590 [Lachnospiraceae bacterium]